MIINRQIPIYCNANFIIGKKVSVFFEGVLLNCKILKRSVCSFGQFYNIEILEYPAKKVRHSS
jgi:hypothetical protein